MKFEKKQYLLVAVVIALVIGVLSFSNHLDHMTFDTVNTNGQVVEDGSTVFIPEGARIIGTAYAYNSNDDELAENSLPENVILSQEMLVRADGEVVVYLDKK